jgi:flagellar basal-body rod protein FlgC
MDTFSTIDVAVTGVTFGQTWMNAIAHNMANVNTVRSADEEPFRAKFLRAEEVLPTDGGTGEGVRLAEIVTAQDDPPIVYDPDNPLADADGYVVRPVIDMAGQMSDLIVAQRHYQFNLRVMDSARLAYESALRIGR